jgi:hypothetical protein
VDGLEDDNWWKYYERATLGNVMMLYDNQPSPFLTFWRQCAVCLTMLLDATDEELGM